MLRIIINMFSQVIKFLCICCILLVLEASVASILFGELAEYVNFLDVFILKFTNGLANYDLDIYEKLSIGKEFGEIYTVICLILNTVIMLNFVIAMLTDTYAKLSISSLGLYYDGLIHRIPIYEDDSQFGGLIVGLPPFNMLALPMIPFYLFVKDEGKLTYVNNAFTKVMFAPFAFILMIFFLAFTLILLPFAYLSAIVKKIKLVVNVRGKFTRQMPERVK